MAFTLVNAGGMSENTGKVRSVNIAAAHATLVAPGDIVRFTGTSDANGVAQVDVVTATGQQVAGVVAGVNYNVAGENLTYTGLAAGIAGDLFIHTSQDLLYTVPTTATLVAADVGLNANADFVVATRSGVLDISNVKLDSATKATTATLQFRIEALLPDAAGVLGNVALVRINNQSATGV